MLNFLMQAEPPAGIFLPAESQQLKIAILVTLLVGFAVMVGLMYAPYRLRRPIVVAATFLSGFFWILVWLFPAPVELGPNEIPRNAMENFGMRLADGIPVVSNISQTLNALLLGLGVFSVLRMHTTRLVKQQKDWVFSVVLLVAMFSMVTVGYMNYNEVLRNPDLADPNKWGRTQFATDFLFDGMLQAMDAAMFSIIAFFILVAAYRAFRIRSIESTVLLGTALIVMLSLMGAVEFASTNMINGITGGDPGHFLNNFALANIRAWIQTNIQGPGIRALEWGIGIGALSMGLRLWLSLEKGGGN